jgi:hypothetical protein
MKTFVVCDHALRCAESGCQWSRPSYDSEIMGGICSVRHISVNIVAISRVLEHKTVGNPNKAFIRRKYDAGNM